MSVVVGVLAAVSFGPYLGWSSIAVFANVATVLLRGTPGFVAGVLWALVAIAIWGSQRQSTPLSVTAMVAAVAVGAVAVVQQARSRTR